MPIKLKFGNFAYLSTHSLVSRKSIDQIQEEIPTMQTAAEDTAECLNFGNDTNL